MDWELIYQLKKTQNNKDNIRENNKRVDHKYKAGNKVMPDNHAAWKYGKPYKGPFAIT